MRRQKRAWELFSDTLKDFSRRASRFVQITKEDIIELVDWSYRNRFCLSGRRKELLLPETVLEKQAPVAPQPRLCFGREGWPSAGTAVLGEVRLNTHEGPVYLLASCIDVMWNIVSTKSLLNKRICDTLLLSSRNIKALGLYDWML